MSWLDYQQAFEEGQGNPIIYQDGSSQSLEKIWSNYSKQPLFEQQTAFHIEYNKICNMTHLNSGSNTVAL